MDVCARVECHVDVCALVECHVDVCALVECHVDVCALVECHVDVCALVAHRPMAHAVCELCVSKGLAGFSATSALCPKCREPQVSVTVKAFMAQGLQVGRSASGWAEARAPHPPHDCRSPHSP